MSFNLINTIMKFFPETNENTKIYFVGIGSTFRHFNSLCTFCGYEIDKQDNCYLVDTNREKWGQPWSHERSKTIIAPHETNKENSVIILTVRWTLLPQVAEYFEKLDFVRYVNLLFCDEFYRHIYSYIFSKSKPYKNMHKGEKCFIIGNGPSLRASDLDILHKNNIPCFAANKIYEIFDQTSWRPMYYCVIDSICFENSLDYILNTKCPIFINLRHALIYIKTEDKAENIVCLGGDSDVALLCLRPVTVSIGDTLCNVDPTATVTFAALQIAFFMGFSEIYLLGVDNFANLNAHHFYTDKAKAIFFSTIREDANSVYQSAYKYANENSIKIYNSTRGGALEVFERIDFDKLFSEAVEE